MDSRHIRDSEYMFETKSFALSNNFLEEFKGKQPEWGPLGYITYKRTYARELPEGGTEEYWQTVARVINGVFTIQKQWCKQLGLPWSDSRAQKTAQKMYRKMWEFKMLAPGRGLWIMGTDFIEKHGSAALNNCAFASTDDIDIKYSKAFEFLMDMSMLGVGVGFDTLGAGKVIIKEPKENGVYVIPDSREGWVESLKKLLDAYFLGKPKYTFDYSIIRPEGSPIKGFGGLSAGPEPLRLLHVDVDALLMERVGQPIKSTDIVDIMNMIGRCVVAGNVRRSAEIALGKADDTEFLTMKQDLAKLESHRWASNNSILATSSMDYSSVVESVWKNGEPGLVWLENAQKYGRLKDGVNWLDKHAKGVNPCFSGDSKLLIESNGVAVEAPFSSIVGETVNVVCPYSDSSIKAEIVETGLKSTITLELSNGISFRCTPDHILCTSDGVEIPASESLDLYLKTTPQQEPPKVISIANYGEELVYDFKMDSIHWGFVNGIVAHNCGEQTLESFELCCVSGDTKIQTISGVYSISSLVGKQVQVWNGDSWSTVTPFVAGEGKDLYRVYLTDGSYLDCTEDHGWNVKGKTKRIYKRIDTKDLTLGDKSIPFSLGAIQGNYEPYAYEYGLFSGDGFIDNDRPMFCAYGEKVNLKNHDIHGVWYKEQTAEGYQDPFSRVSFNGILDLNKCQDLNDKTKGLPSWVFELDRESILEFVAGLTDTDGNVCQQVATDNYRIFGNEEKIRDLQTLLRRIGIDHSSVYSVGEAGEETNLGTRNYSVYCCYIPSYECADIPTKLKKAQRIGNRYRTNNAHPEGQKIDGALNQRVSKIEKLDGKHVTYCFSEPENHMGVFGNVLTFQCLVETFPSRHESYEEFEDTLKMAYLYGKSVTLVNTHWAETNAVMLKNRRMGISQTGIINAIGRHGLTHMLDWCDKGYNCLKKVDELYSAWLCVPLSKKLTTVKPSGTVSLLAGVSAGIHYPHSKHYIRRIRFDANSEYLPALRASGYKIEQDVYSANSVCVEFPVEEPFFTIGKNDVTVWEQLENAGMYQYHWSDNQVSITVTFKENEKQDLKRALEYFEHRLKSVSLLPLNDSGYKQMPYETITEEVYRDRVKDLKPLDLSNSRRAGVGERFCSNDVCEIKR
jgi:intein/homing endonuclease